MNRFTLLSLLLLASCRPEPTIKLVSNETSFKSDRFEISRVEVFEDDIAYNDRRGIYVLKDKTTGKEYIGVSGIGITERGSHAAGKNRLSDER